jgi:hypothetical protein
MVEETRTWPVGGGLLDQSHQFMEYHRFYQGQRAHWESERVKPKSEVNG